MKIAPRFFNVRWREIEKDERKIREFINKNVTSLFQAAKSLRVCLSLFFQNSVWTFLFSFHVQVFTTLREKKTKKKNNLIFFSFSHFEMRSDPLTFSSLIDIKGGKITHKKGTGWQEGGHKMAAHQTNKHTYPSPLEINSKRWRDTISRFFFFFIFLTFSCWAKWPVTPIVSSYLKSKQNSRNNNNKWKNSIFLFQKKNK